MFFDQNGVFRLDEIVLESKTFQKIMADEVVTDEEIKEQAELVVSLYKELEEELSKDQLAKIANAIVQMGVLQEAMLIQELQELQY